MADNPVRHRHHRSSRWTRRFKMSDPGGVRLETALGMVTTIAASVLVGWLLSHRFDLLEVTVVVPTAPGGTVTAVSHPVAMVVSGLAAMVMLIGTQPALARPRFLGMIRRPPAFLLGVVAGVLIGPTKIVAVVALCLLATGLVLLQRFPEIVPLGMPLFFGSFIAIFVHLRVEHLGWIALLVGSSATVAIVIQFTLFPPHPVRKLARYLATFDLADAEVLHRASILLTGHRNETDAVHQLRMAARALRRSALLVDGHLEAATGSGHRDRLGDLHRHVFDREAKLHALVRASLDYVEVDAAAEDRQRFAAAVDDLIAADPEAAQEKAAPLLDRDRKIWEQSTSTDTQTRRIARASIRLARPLVELADPHRGTATQASRSPVSFRPTVTAMGGHLVGTAPVTAEALSTDPDAPSPLLAPVIARRAVRMALAVALSSGIGLVIAPDRWYWAFFAAFAVMMAANTATEHVYAALERALGTAGGVLAGIASAHLLADRPLVSFALIFVALGVAFYFQQPSTIVNTFSMSVMVSQLYVQLGSYSDRVLLTRMAETAAGAAVAIGVSLLVFRVPTSTVAQTAIRNHTESIRTVLANVIAHLEGRAPSSELRSDVRAAQEAWRQVHQVVEPTSILARRRRTELSSAHLALVGRITADAANLARQASGPLDLDEAQRQRLGEAGDDLTALLMLASAGSETGMIGARVPQPSTALDRARQAISGEQEQEVIRELGILEQHLLELVGSFDPSTAD